VDSARYIICPEAAIHIRNIVRRRAQNRIHIIESTGTLEITPREITITGATASKEYDGTPLSLNSSKLTSGTIAPSELLTSVATTGSQTTVNVNISYNTPSAAVIVRGEGAAQVDVTNNYNINYIYWRRITQSILQS